MEIRELKATELDALLSLYGELHPNDEPISMKRAVALWREIQFNTRLKYFGCFVDDELVSSCTLSVIPNLTRGGKPYGLIENVVTRLSHRRRGCGKRVLAFALEQAWQDGCYKVMLMTGRLDEGTFAFYEAAGFNRHDKQAFVAKPIK